MTRPRSGHGSWEAILERAAEIVASYDTGVTLRQLFYRLVSQGILRNETAEYKQLSARTAEARRDGWFPALIDRTRTIHRYPTWESPGEAMRWCAAIYMRNRTEGQVCSVYLGVEKAGIVEQLESWFGGFSLPMLALGGYGSQTYVDEIIEDVDRQDRPAVLLYAGDWDPSGENILEDFEGRTECFDTVERVALTLGQVKQYDLPVMPGKATDTRARAFAEKYGVLGQVEVDALPPELLKELFDQAISRWFDLSTWEREVEREKTEREEAVRAVDLHWPDKVSG